MDEAEKRKEARERFLQLVAEAKPSHYREPTYTLTVMLHPTEGWKFFVEHDK